MARSNNGMVWSDYDMRWHNNDMGWPNNGMAWPNNDTAWHNNDMGWPNNGVAWPNNDTAWHNNGMVWSNNYTQPRRPPYGLYFLIACLILMIIIAVVLGVVIPVSLTTNSGSTYNQASPFNVTYLVGGQSSRSIVDGIDLSSIDFGQVAQSFENALNISLQNILHIGNIYSDTAIGSKSISRHKRSVQCNGDSSGASGSVLIFDFNITYPTNLPCESRSCINGTFADVIQRFKSHQNLSINFGNVTKALRLCSFGVFSSSGTETTVSTTQSSTIVSVAQSSTTILSTNNGFDMSSAMTQNSNLNGLSSAAMVISSNAASTMGVSSTAAYVSSNTASTLIVSSAAMVISSNAASAMSMSSTAAYVSSNTASTLIVSSAAMVISSNAASTMSVSSTAAYVLSTGMSAVNASA